MQLQNKCLYLLLNVIVAMCAREPSSPICSKYDYEERLLERVLRNELALETTLSEIMKTNAKVVDALKQLEDGKVKVESTLAVMEKKQIEMEFRLNAFINNASNIMNSTLASNVNAIEKKQIGMESRLNEFINNASNNINLTLAANAGALVKTASEIKANATVTVQQLVNEVHIIKDRLKIPTIYFRARITSITTIQRNQDVVYPTVDVNEGEGYDPARGKFTVSVPGLYLFSVQYCVQVKKHVALEIVLMGKSIQRSLSGDHFEYSCVTMQVMTWVAIGNEVWVRSAHTSSVYANEYRFNSFSGALIHL